MTRPGSWKPPSRENYQTITKTENGHQLHSIRTDMIVSTGCNINQVALGKVIFHHICL